MGGAVSTSNLLIEEQQDYREAILNAGYAIYDSHHAHVIVNKGKVIATCISGRGSECGFPCLILNDNIDELIRFVSDVGINDFGYDLYVMNGTHNRGLYPYGMFGNASGDFLAIEESDDGKSKCVFYDTVKPNAEHYYCLRTMVNAIPKIENKFICAIEPFDSVPLSQPTLFDSDDEQEAPKPNTVDSRDLFQRCLASLPEKSNVRYIYSNGYLYDLETDHEGVKYSPHAFAKLMMDYNVIHAE